MVENIKSFEFQYSSTMLIISAKRKTVGMCPSYSKGGCINVCETHNQCPADQYCCNHGCGQMCVKGQSKFYNQLPWFL